MKATTSAVTITVKAGNGTNYSAADNKTASVTVGRKGVAFPSCSSKTYTAASQTLFAAHTSGEYTNSAITGTNVGSYTGDLTPTSNYQWNTTSNKTSATNVTCKINPKSVAVTWGSTTTFTYNGSAQAPTASVTTGISAETMSITRTTQTNAGSYTSTASCSSVSGGRGKCGNYSFTNTTKSFSIIDPIKYYTMSL